MAKTIIEELAGLSVTPAEPQVFEAWLKMQDAIAFLDQNLSSDDFVVFAVSEFTFIHSVLVPRSNVIPPQKDDLLRWNFNPTSSWAVWTSFGENPSASISAPLDDTGSKTLKGGEQIVFSRYFEGRLGDKTYYEICQKIVHLLGLHFLPERNAYCRLNDSGDIEECIRIIDKPDNGEQRGVTAVIFNRRLLDQYAALTDSVIVRMFDFTRYRSSGFSGWSGNKADEISAGTLLYHIYVQPGYASYMRGVQIVEPNLSKDTVAKDMADGKNDREYASFIAQDWKNDCVTEISSAPEKTSNYFTQSDQPFELSPAFFRPEVLLKYKADSEKYQIKDRSISCRGSWHLQSYDINEAGQVHAYICDLRHLPYQEQLHWKFYNEPPKAPISKRAFTADFEGRWSLEYDALSSLKQLLRDWSRKNLPWWTLREQGLVDRVHYPVTTSPDEWANEILQLDQLMVEGFVEKFLRKQAQNLGRTPPDTFRSLKLVEECLIGFGFEADHAAQIMASLQRLHSLRSKMKGHAAGDERVKIKQTAIKDHGSYKAHFQKLCEECDESLRIIEGAFNSKVS